MIPAMRQPAASHQPELSSPGAGSGVRVVTIRRPELVGVRAHLALAGVTAALLTLAFPPYSLRPLVFVALVPLALLGLRSRGGWRLGWTTWLVGFAWWSWTMRWMSPVTGGGVLALGAFLGLYWPVFLFALRALVRGLRLPATLAVPMAWVSLEWLRGVAPATGFGWYALSHAIPPAGPEDGVSRLMQVADLAGEWTITAVIALSSGLLVDLLTRPWVSPATGRWSRGLGGVLALTLAVVVGAQAYGAWRVGQAAGQARPGPRVLLVQTNIPQSNKDSPDLERIRANFLSLAQLTAQGLQDALQAGAPPDLIAWPETIVPFSINPEAVAFLDERGYGLSGEMARRVEALASRLGRPLVVGAHAKFDFTVREGPGASGDGYPVAGRSYNSAYLYDARGRQVSRYDKVHRVPFGEFVPWVDAWPWLKRQFIKHLTPYESDYTLTPGEGFTVFELPIAGGGVSRWVTPICFEDAVPRVTRRMVFEDGGRRRADVFLNITNDGWFAGSPEQVMHLMIAGLRCVECRTPMARSVNTGISSAIDSSGRVTRVFELGGVRQGVEGSLLAELMLDARTPPFARLGTWPAGLVAGSTLGLCVAGGWRLRRARRRTPGGEEGGSAGAMEAAGASEASHDVGGGIARRGRCCIVSVGDGACVWLPGWNGRAAVVDRHENPR